MKAILMTQAGGPDLLTEADIPEPRITEASQIKVQLKAAGINPIDTKLRKRGVFFDGNLPAILGCDGAGVVVETGSGVSKFKVGDKVWYCHGGLGGDQGNYAEFNVLNERWVSHMPKSISFEQAAAGPLVLITAWGALYDRARLQQSNTVLIHAGAGGVGHVAIQLARLHGAKVFATVGSDHKVALARSWGADEVINYQTQDFVQAVNELTDGKGAEVVLDTVGPDVFDRSINCTAHFGTIVTLLEIGLTNLQEARFRNLRFGFELMLTPQLRQLSGGLDLQVDMLNQCGRWIDEGKLHLHVSETLPLAEAAKAHQLIEEGHVTGKVVLKIS